MQLASQTIENAEQWSTDEEDTDDRMDTDIIEEMQKGWTEDEQSGPSTSVVKTANLVSFFL